MIEESCRLKDRVQWYTTMLGKFGSVGTVVENLKERGISNWAVKEFVQGTRTRRWGVAWSWNDMRPSMASKTPERIYSLSLSLEFLPSIALTAHRKLQEESPLSPSIFSLFPRNFIARQSVLQRQSSHLDSTKSSIHSISSGNSDPPL